MSWTLDEALFEKTGILDVYHFGILQISIDWNIEENREVVGYLRTPRYFSTFSASGSVDTQALTVTIPGVKTFQVVGIESLPHVQDPVDAYAAILRLTTEDALALSKLIVSQAEAAVRARIG